jgi:hypothetical protein
MPGFDGLVGKGLEKEITQLRKDLLGDGDADAMRELPKTGLSPKEIVEKLKTAKVRVFFYISRVFHNSQGGGSTTNDSSSGSSFSHPKYPPLPLPILVGHV